MARRGVMFVWLPFLAGGCFGHPPYKIGDPDPDSNIPAMKIAALSHDAKSQAALVQQLSSDDPAVRFYAIDALRRLTGQTFGYRYYDDDEDRKPAVERWKRWLEQKRGK